jgi:hypothetical protein
MALWMGCTQRRHADQRSVPEGVARRRCGNERPGRLVLDHHGPQQLARADVQAQHSGLDPAVPAGVVTDRTDQQCSVDHGERGEDVPTVDGHRHRGSSEGAERKDTPIEGHVELVDLVVACDECLTSGHRHAEQRGPADADRVEDEVAGVESDHPGQLPAECRVEFDHAHRLLLLCRGHDHAEHRHPGVVGMLGEHCIDDHRLEVVANEADGDLLPDGVALDCGDEARCRRDSDTVDVDDPVTGQDQPVGRARRHDVLDERSEPGAECEPAGSNADVGDIVVEPLGHRRNIRGPRTAVGASGSGQGEDDDDHDCPAHRGRVLRLAQCAMRDARLPSPDARLPSRRRGR